LIDPVLEEEIRELESFLGLWNDYTQLAEQLRKREGGAERREKEFSELRGDLARRYRALMDKLEVSCGAGDEVTDILTRLGTPAAVTSLTDLQWKRLEESRRHAEVLLQGLMGILQNRQQGLRGTSKGYIVLRRVLVSWPLKLLYLAVGIIIALLVLNKFIY
jgi:hypothetical protein